MQLTCPTCRSGLQVPDGTTAHVRCPTCRTIFPAAAGLAPPLPPPPPVPVPLPLDEDDRPRRKPRPGPDEDDDRPRQRRRDEDDDRPRRRREEEDDDRPRRRGERRYEDDDRPRGRRPREDEEEPPKPRKRRRYDDDDGGGLSPEEKRRLAESFARGMWGSRLVAASLVFYTISLVLIPLYYIIWALTKEPMPVLLVAAGILGLINWVLGAIGVGLCVSGPVSPGHYRYAISAAVLVFVHLVLLFSQANRGEGFGINRDLDRSVIRWMQVPTQFDSLTFYLAYVAYPDDIPIRRADTGLSFTTGVVEMCRLVLILMALAGMAQAAGDKDLGHRCTRVAGRASFVPGALALAVLVYKVVMIETGADAHGYVPLFALVLQMGIYLVPAGMLLGAFAAARDVADACEFPYQSAAIDLGG